MSLITDANDTIRRLEAELAALYGRLQEAHAERDNAARNERIRWADRAEALAVEYRTGIAGRDVSDSIGLGAARALEALAAELRAEGGGT